MISVLVPIATVSESNSRDHWRKKAARVAEQRAVVGIVLRPRLAALGTWQSLAVTLTRVSPRSLDDDNLRGALKAARDSVAKELGIDDRDPIVAWRYGQEKSKSMGVRIEIRKAEAA